MNATGFGIDALSFKMGFDKTLISLLTPLLTLLKIIGKKIQSVVQIFINTQIIQLSQIAIEPPKNKSNCATAHTKVETAHKSIELHWNKSQEGQRYRKCSFTSVSPEKETVHLNSYPVADFLAATRLLGVCDVGYKPTQRLRIKRILSITTLRQVKFIAYNIKAQSSTKLAPPVPQSGT